MTARKGASVSILLAQYYSSDYIEKKSDVGGACCMFGGKISGAEFLYGNSIRRDYLQDQDVE
jgi:hypothetical protein